MALILLLLCCLFLSGCWDYKGLNTIDIVTGIAVDKDPASGQYILTIEIINTRNTSVTNQTIYIEAEGETFFKAIRNSKKRLINQLYLGNLQTVIISQQIAKTEGVNQVMEMLVRAGEPRETLSIVISQEKTAREILLTEGLDSGIIAYEIHEMALEDNRVTCSTKDLPMYKVYEAIHGVGNSLVLPAIRCIENDGKLVSESNGIAIFKGDKLIGFDSPHDTMHYLFVMDEIKGGGLAFQTNASDKLISLEIIHSKTKLDVMPESGKLQVLLQINLKLNITELTSQLDISKPRHRSDLEAWVAHKLEQRITDYLQQVQTTYQTDIFGLGNLIYQKDPDLWRSIEVEGNWDRWFQNASFEVQTQTDILNAGVLKNY